MKNKQQNKNNQNRIYLAMEPVHEKEEITYYKIHLVNTALSDISFEYVFHLKDRLDFIYKNIVPKSSAFFLNTIQFIDLNDNPVLDLSITSKEIGLKIKKTIKIKPKDLSRKLRYIPEIDHEGYLLIIHQKTTERKGEEIVNVKEMDIDHLKEMMLESKFIKHTSLQQMAGPSYKIIDLHIEQLHPGHKRMSNDEIIHHQLTYLQKQLDKALEEGLSKMYVVHGLGKGKLKNEIFDILSTYPGVQSYDNSYDKRFGFGATEIIFK